MKKKVFAVLCLVMLLVFTACDSDPTQDWFVQTQWLRAFAGDFNLETILTDVADGGDISIDYDFEEVDETANEYLLTINFDSYEIGRYSRINSGTLMLRIGVTGTQGEFNYTMAASDLDVDTVYVSDDLVFNANQTVKLKDVSIRSVDTGKINATVNVPSADSKIVIESATIEPTTRFTCGTATTTYENGI